MSGIVAARDDPRAGAVEERRGDRLGSVDLLRGLVMVLMALDHVRTYFSDSRADPENLTEATSALFLTRWVTHFCAPVFVFLAGTGASLALARGRDRGRGELARFLVTRGLWLVTLEFTLVRLGWSFNLDYRFTVGQVIWAIGWSLVALGGLVALGLTPAIIGSIGLAIVCGHNLVDGVSGERFGRLEWVWDLLFARRAFEPFPGYTFVSVYPLVPWFGVLAAGYGFGLLLDGGDRGGQRESPARRARRTRLIALGLAITAAFVVLRWRNGYGDPHPWRPQGDPLRTVLSFVGTTMFPPSLQFVLMTLGPAIVVLGLFDRPAGPLARIFITYGRVPLFYYLVHFPMIHALAVVVALWQYGRADWLFLNPPAEPPPGFGFGLPVVYLIWLGVVASLYVPCRWYAGLKRRRGGALRYL